MIRYRREEAFKELNRVTECAFTFEELTKLNKENFEIRIVNTKELRQKTQKKSLAFLRRCGGQWTIFVHEEIVKAPAVYKRALLHELGHTRNGSMPRKDLLKEIVYMLENLDHKMFKEIHSEIFAYFKMNGGMLDG